MRYKYYFKNSVDYIENEILRKDAYNNFISEINELNKEYGYSLYLFGSYVGFIIEKLEYSDVDFIITSEKVLEIEYLTKFFKSFHEICKKYNVAYNLMYSTDKKSEDFNTNRYSGFLFNSPSRVLTLYQQIESELTPPYSYMPLIGSDLFETVMDKPSTKAIKKMQMGTKFYYPIKIQ